MSTLTFPNQILEILEESFTPLKQHLKNVLEKHMIVVTIIELFAFILNENRSAAVKNTAYFTC